MHDGGEIAGKVGGVGSGREIIFFSGALEAIAEGGDERFAVANEFFTHTVGVVAAGEGTLHGEAAAGVGRVGEILHCAVEKLFGDSAGGGLV